MIPTRAPNDTGAALLALLSRQEGHVQTMMTLLSALVKDSERRHAELRQGLELTMRQVGECLGGQATLNGREASGVIDLDDVLSVKENSSFGKDTAVRMFEGFSPNYYAASDHYALGATEKVLTEIESLKAQVQHASFNNQSSSLSAEIHQMLGAFLKSTPGLAEREQSMMPAGNAVVPDAGTSSESKVALRTFSFTGNAEIDKELDEEGLGDDGSASTETRQFGYGSGGLVRDGVRQEYQTESKYKREGWAQAIARDSMFGNLVFFMILLNSIFMALDTSFNNESSLYQADWFFIVFANAFCVFFLIELIIRFLAFRRRKDCLRDAWFVFDACLMCFMIGETWLIDPATYLIYGSLQNNKYSVQPWRILRLARIARVSMVVRNVPELSTMTRGLFQGTRACAASIVMILLLVYCFGMVMYALLHEEQALHDLVHPLLGVGFDTLGKCMWILMVNGTFMLDGTGDLVTILLFHPGYQAKLGCLIFTGFMFLSAMMISNLLIGVLCEVVTTVAEAERNHKAIKLLKKTILKHLQAYDDGNGMISFDEFEEIINGPESRQTLAELNVDRNFMFALQEVAFKDRKDRQISIKVVMEMMLTCRAESPATVHTIANSLAYLGTKLNSLDTSVKILQSNFQMLKAESK